MKQKRKISHEALQEAIQKYIKKGGLIEQLPEQKTAPRSRVGGKWSNSELGSLSGN